MAGFDGVAYKSHLGSGINVVLFNIDAASLGRRHVYSLKKVRYEFEAEPPYQIYLKKGGVGKDLMRIVTESSS